MALSSHNFRKMFGNAHSVLGNGNETLNSSAGSWSGLNWYMPVLLPFKHYLKEKILPVLVYKFDKILVRNFTKPNQTKPIQTHPPKAMTNRWSCLLVSAGNFP